MNYGRGILFSAVACAVLFALASGGWFDQHWEAYVAGAIEGGLFGALFGLVLSLTAGMGLTRVWVHDLFASLVVMGVFTFLGTLLLRVEINGVSIRVDTGDLKDIILFGCVVSTAFTLGARPRPASWKGYFRA